ncbi:MAG: acyltransferase [Rubrivivax sp.]|nr:MAG: acyltransferase [Rubrivivax sp.]
MELGMLRMLKRWTRDLLYRPAGLGTLGRDACIRLPRRVRGAGCIHIGERVVIDSHAWLEAFEQWHGQRFSPRIEIGDDVTIGRHVTITATTRVVIGAGSLFSEGVYVSDAGHDVFGTGSLPLVERPLLELGPVHIGPRCFIGFRACVLPGVTLGEGCVVGAQSVVTRSFPAGSVIAGAPARLLRRKPGLEKEVDDQ